MDLAFLNSLARYPGHASGRSLDVRKDDQLLLLGIPARGGAGEALGRRPDGRLQPRDRVLRRLLVRLRPRAWACGSRAATCASASPPGPHRLRRKPRRRASTPGRIRSPRDFDYFHASRVIGPEQFKTINEFPFFTFFHADLHPAPARVSVLHRRLRRGASLDRGRPAAGRLRPRAAGPSSWLSSPARRGPRTSGTCRRSRSSWSSCGALRPTRGERLPELPAALGGALTGAVVVAAVSLVLFYPYTPVLPARRTAAWAGRPCTRECSSFSALSSSSWRLAPPASPRPPSAAVAAAPAAPTPSTRRAAATSS